jgi:hypothetical protein
MSIYQMGGMKTRFGLMQAGNLTGKWHKLLGYPDDLKCLMYPAIHSSNRRSTIKIATYNILSLSKLKAGPFGPAAPIAVLYRRWLSQRSINLYVR